MPHHPELYYTWNVLSGVNQRICSNVLTVMMQQRAMFDFLLHVIQLYGLIFASCDDKPLTGCHSCYGCCVGMMCEVGYGCPLLNDKQRYMVATQKKKDMGAHGRGLVKRTENRVKLPLN